MNVWPGLYQTSCTCKKENIWTELEHIVGSSLTPFLTLNLKMFQCFLGNRKCDAEDWDNEVDLLAFKAISIQSCWFFLFILWKLKSEQVRHSYHVGLGGRLVWRQQKSASAGRFKDGPKHPKQNRETCEWNELILICSANWVLNGFSVLTTQGWSCNTAAALAL